MALGWINRHDANNLSVAGRRPISARHGHLKPSESTALLRQFIEDLPLFDHGRHFVCGVGASFQKNPAGVVRLPE